MKANHCPICKKSSLLGNYCKYHQKALDEMKLAFEKWEKAYEEMPWERYLETISKLQNTGNWAIEVAKNELLIMSQKTSAQYKAE